MGSSVSSQNEMLKIKIGGDEKTNRNRHRRPYNRVKTTKSTLLTFLPLNLFAQFRRLAYFYYLIVTVISFFVNSTISPLTSLIPLLFVIIVSAVKQAREEFLRYRADKIVNNYPVIVLRHGERFAITAQFVAPGDLVIIKRDCDVPCDLILLSSFDSHGKCFVTTANLDGETNLKTLKVPRNLIQCEIGDLERLGTIECEPSTTDLYSFNGRINLAGDLNEIIPLSAENLLLSGAHVKSSDIIGCAVYTGMTSKLQLNSHLTSNKAASSDAYINRYLLFLVIVMLIFVTVLYIFERHDEVFTVPLMFYLGTPVNVNNIAEILEEFLSFLVIANYMIPVSMYMNIELYRVIGALFLSWDLQLYDEETDQPCIVNTSNLNEELGQINFIFSDKTGTLTKNEMVFHSCSIRGEKFVYMPLKCGLQSMETEAVIEMESFDQEKLEFFHALAICHTVQLIESFENFQIHQEITETDNIQPSIQRGISSLTEAKIFEKKSHETEAYEETIASPNEVNVKRNRSSSFISLNSNAVSNQFDQPALKRIYQASSADEKALLEACAQLGLVYLGDANEILRIRLQSGSGSSAQDFQYKRLHILEFTPERRRMSVIVENSNKEIWIYSKGAESAIFPLCENSLSDLASETDIHITDFSKMGLRTLAIAKKKLTDEEYYDFYQDLTIANNSLDLRKQLTEKCYTKVEKDLHLIGATAVEDVLQDNVAETLYSLRKAGLQIWVLTGDKVETALNIAIACGHIPSNAKTHIISNSTSDNLIFRLTAVETDLRAGKQVALLIDGESLAVALKEIANDFRTIAIKCCSVLCCRLSPLQKSEVVALIKSSRGNFITAAIGDGANDVSMIQEADVGIGIMGKEGRQAARAADFAISKFSMLKRLLLVHGHYNTARLSFLVLFYCYKNVVITGNMFLYQFHSLFSATSVYNSLFLWLYDVIYISGGMTCVSLLERPYPEEVLLSKPELYKKNGKNKQVRWSVFLTWMLNGLYQTIIIYLLTYFALTCNDVFWNNGQTLDFNSFGTILVQIVIFVQNLKLLLTAQHLNYWLLGIVIASMILFVISTVIYNVADTSSSLYLMYNHLLGSVPAWLLTVLLIVASLLPDYTYAVSKKLFKFNFLTNTSV